MPEMNPMGAINVAGAGGQKRADEELFNSLGGGQFDANYATMEKSVKSMAKVPTLMETIMPKIQELLGPGSMNPTLQAIDRSTSSNVAADQTEMMKRGLTGSDIEAGAMSASRATGEQAKAGVLAQGSLNIAQIMKELATGDIASQRENIMAFAQMLGQKITSDQDLMMFREQLAAGIEQADKNRDSQMNAAMIGMVGSLGGAAITGGMRYSDERLKTDVVKIGCAGGLDIVSFKWNDKGRAMGGHDGAEFGVLAQDVERNYPMAVLEHNGYKMVDYSKIPKEVAESVNRLGGYNA